MAVTADGIFASRHPLRTRDCYEAVVDEFDGKCVNLPQVSVAEMADFPHGPNLCLFIKIYLQYWMVFLGISKYKQKSINHVRQTYIIGK